MKLSDISNIFIGILKNRELSLDRTKYKYNLLDYSNFSGGYVGFENVKPIYAYEQIDEKMILKPNDILIKLFLPISFGLVGSDVPDNIIVPSNFAIIRPINDFDSKLLCYLISQKDKDFWNFCTGSVVRNLRISSIKEIEFNEVIDEKIKIKSKLYWLNEKLKLLMNKKSELLNSKIKYYLKNGENKNEK